jgi:hypothetical protein
VVIAAGGASPGIEGDHLAGGVRAELDAVDQVAVALVVDERTGAELADGQETGALQVVTVAVAASVQGDVGRQRQAREGVAGQEALAGQIAVGVEVRQHRFAVHALVLQQVELGLRLLALALGHPAVAVGERVVEAAPVLLRLVGQRGAEQIAPAVEGPVERLRSPANLLLDPIVVPPRGRFVETGRHIVEHPVRSRHCTPLSLPVACVGFDHGVQA